MTDINETIRLARDGATVISDAVHGKSPTITACLSQAAAIRELVALHTGTCELLTEIAKDYDHPWPNEDRVTEVHRTRMCVAIRKRLTEIAAKQEQGKKERTCQ